jgi:metal-responsive CopG/Arc/MetJ family transcriptional regulator
MSQTTIYIDDDTVAEIDDRRHSTTSRSKWIKEAIQARLDAEDDDVWEDVSSSSDDDSVEA